MDNLDDAFTVKKPVESTGEFSLLLPDTATAIIVGQEERTTKAGPKANVLEIDVLDGANAGRKVFEYLNFNSPTAVAVRIAAETLSSIALAVGLTEGTVVKRDFSNILNKRFTMVVSVVPKKKDGKILEGQFENKKKFLPYGSMTTASAAAESPKAVETPTGEKTVAPWKRKTQ